MNGVLNALKAIASILVSFIVLSYNMLVPTQERFSQLRHHLIDTRFKMATVPLGPDQERSKWPFQAGNPEFWRYRDQLVKPGGTVLDLGIDDARSSLFFANHGMRVVGLDSNPTSVGISNVIGEALAVNLQAYEGDLRTIDLGTELFDIVIADNLFIHFTDKEEALKVIQAGIQALKPQGHLWIRAVSKLHEQYQRL